MTISYECKAIAQLLIERGADVNKGRDDGTTPLSLSKEEGGFANDILIAAGAH